MVYYTWDDQWWCWWIDCSVRVVLSWGGDVGISDMRYNRQVETETICMLKLVSPWVERTLLISHRSRNNFGEEGRRRSLAAEALALRRTWTGTGSNNSWGTINTGRSIVSSSWGTINTSGSKVSSSWSTNTGRGRGLTFIGSIGS